MYKIEQRSPVDPRMMVVGIVPDPKGLALRTFECGKRDHSFAKHSHFVCRVGLGHFRK